MILLDNVSKLYPGDKEPALDSVSLHIEPNEFVFLVGKSGAGKSTLIKMITKEEIPDSGKIVIGGIDLDYVKSVISLAIEEDWVWCFRILNFCREERFMRMWRLRLKLLV